MSDIDEILTRQRGTTLWITLNRPQARNALTFGMYARLAALCQEAPTDGSVRALVIHGAGGKAFAAGTDIGQFRDFDGAGDALAYEARMDAVLRDIECCPLPTIAAIHGACTGGGAAIAAACDLRLASAQMRFGLPIARTLGNCLSAANLARLGALIGPGRVRELIFTARLMEAPEAQAAGLVSEVLEDEAALMARAQALADQLAGMAPLTLRATKEAQRRLQVAGVEDADLIEMCYTSADFRTGLEAFLEREVPAWTGK
jgi:enoyl-CoA hydratase